MLRIEAKRLSRAAILQAVKIMRSEFNLARKIKTTRQKLNYWKLYSLIPYDRAIAIHILTCGKVSVNQLRPDLKRLTEDFKKMTKLGL